ncbi:Leucyl-tRNA synthetase [Heracleum sosnowskyi]|uniref:Leucyl-tRNA synthetase n=1 Tax=Heracleum sosnowskyi TaxID=360622 RepID=A0AAD8MJC5_9APIA|nr:Leucyl-tRNA synthetase [Heracleum sosnowskyi]
MPQKKFDADALGVVTICLVAVLVLICVICIVYSFYFRSRVHNQGFVQLGYFSGPWIIRIAFIIFAIWWGVGEIIRLNFIRREGRALNANFKWQKTVCKCYIVSNLGMAEPCLFLTLVFLLRASLQETESGTLSQKWNYKTAGYILLFCFPVFVLQLMVILIGPKFSKGGSYQRHLPHYFTNTVGSTKQADDDTALCTFPLLSTIFLGIFALMNLQDLEAMRRISDEYADTISLLANRTAIEEIDAGSSSGTSSKHGSVLFGTMDKYESVGRFVELSLFSASQHSSPPGSPQLLR